MRVIWTNNWIFWNNSQYSVSWAKCVTCIHDVPNSCCTRLFFSRSSAKISIDLICFALNSCNSIWKRSVQTTSYHQGWTRFTMSNLCFWPSKLNLTNCGNLQNEIRLHYFHCLGKWYWGRFTEINFCRLKKKDLYREGTCSGLGIWELISRKHDLNFCFLIEIGS